MIDFAQFYSSLFWKFANPLSFLCLIFVCAKLHSLNLSQPLTLCRPDSLLVFDEMFGLLNLTQGQL